MIKVAEPWRPVLSPVMNSKVFQRLGKKLDKRMKAGAKVYPKAEHVFRCLDFFPPKETRVVILGQDPYHGEGQANGLAFSVNSDQALPPSLKNILIELEDDVSVEKEDGDLSGWAKQGVLLLNTTLTVEKSAPGSHAGWGWEDVTDSIILHLSALPSPIVFVLWGKHAAKKKKYIDETSNKIIESTHPSPLSAHKGFLGSRPFSKINVLLEQIGKQPIDWSK